MVLGGETNTSLYTLDGAELFESNCYRHARVMREWAPKLSSVLKSYNKSS